MQKITKSMLVFVISLFAISLTAGCAQMERASKDRTAYMFYHKPLPEASRALEAARAAGKDKQCPEEFKAANDAVNKAYDVYMACRTQEAIGLAQDAISKINALCPPKQVVAPPPPPPAPTATLSADPASVKQNRCATISWATANATRVVIDQGIGNVEGSGSKQVCPKSTTTYTIVASGAGGIQTQTATVTVIPLAPKTIVFEEAALFDFDKSDLKPGGKEQIKAYREQAREELSRADKIKIAGHTDNVGSAEYNMKLSLRRAEAVRDYVVSLGVDPAKIEIAGKGESEPVADNSTPEGRAKNRRVEVDVIGLEK